MLPGSKPPIKGTSIVCDCMFRICLVLVLGLLTYYILYVGSFIDIVMIPGTKPPMKGTNMVCHCMFRICLVLVLDWSTCIILYAGSLTYILMIPGSKPLPGSPGRHGRGQSHCFIIEVEDCTDT